MKLSVAFLNLKPGTGKTTGAVWLSYALHELGHEVLYVDADKAASGLEWSDIIAAGDTASRGFPFRVIGMASPELHHRVPEVARPDEIAVIDVPQMEDHAAIARSAIRLADERIIPVAPHGIEINRMAPVLQEISDIDPLRARPGRTSVLLNRVVRSSTAAEEAREDLADDGYDVLSAEIPFLVKYSQSFGLPVKARATEFESLAHELLKRAEVTA